MIYKDFKIDIDNRIIKLNSKNTGKSYSVKELYSYLMDVFDEPEYMRYDLPIEAISEIEFRLVNGWNIDKNLNKLLKGKLLEDKIKIESK